MMYLWGGKHMASEECLLMFIYWTAKQLFATIFLCLLNVIGSLDPHVLYDINASVKEYNDKFANVR